MGAVGAGYTACGVVCIARPFLLWWEIFIVVTEHTADKYGLLPSTPPPPPTVYYTGKECLYLSDIFAVVPGPNRPPPRSRGPRRLSSSSIDSCCEFTVHALRAVPGTPGALTRLTFKSTKTTSVTDACDVWVQQIKHQLQSELSSLRKTHKCTYIWVCILPIYTALSA